MISSTPVNLSEEKALELQELMPKHSLVNSISYKWDNSADVIKTVFTMAYIGLGQLKLNDVSRRLLNELDQHIILNKSMFILNINMDLFFMKN